MTPSTSIVQELGPEQQRLQNAERRRLRYQSDPDYRARVQASNRKYLKTRREEGPTKVDFFDDILEGLKKKWALEEEANARRT